MTLPDLAPAEAGQDDVSIQAAILWAKSRAGGAVPRIPVLGADGIARLLQEGDLPEEVAPVLPATWRCVVGAGFARLDRDGRLTLTPQGFYLRTDPGVTEASSAE